MTSKKLKVLIVDDSPLVAPRVKNLIENISPDVIIGESVNAEEGLNIIREVVPDIVLLDLNLPGQNGIEVLSEIKKNYPKMTVIIFTNHSEPYYRELCKNIGADYFFDKSTEFELLPEVFRALTTEQDLSDVIQTTTIH